MDGLAHQAQVEVLNVRVVRDPAPPIGEGLRVPVLATRRDLGAAAHRFQVAPVHSMVLPSLKVIFWRRVRGH